MKQYQADYSVVVETKEGKSTEFLVETFESETRIGRFDQYRHRLKGKKA